MPIKISKIHGSYLSAIIFAALLERSFYYFITDMISSTLYTYYSYSNEEIANIKLIISYLSGGLSLIGAFLSDFLLGKFYTLYLSLSIYNIAAGSIIYANLVKSDKNYKISLFLIAICSGLIRANIITYGYSKLKYRANIWFFIVSYYFYINIGIVFSVIFRFSLLSIIGYSLTYIFFTACLHLTLIIIYSIESSFSSGSISKQEDIEITNEIEIIKPSILQIIKILIIVLFNAIGRYNGSNLCNKLSNHFDEKFKSFIYAEKTLPLLNSFVVCIFCFFFNYNLDKIFLKFFIGNIFALSCSIFNVGIYFFYNFKNNTLNFIFYIILLLLYSLTESIINITSYFLVYRYSPKGYECLSLGILLLSQFISRFLIFFSNWIGKTELIGSIIALFFCSLGLLSFLVLFGFKSVFYNCNLSAKNHMYGD